MPFEELLEDRESGSLAIVAEAAAHFQELLGGNFDAQEQFVREDLGRLVAAHSGVAAVLNLANGILLAFDGGGAKEALKFLDTFVGALNRSVQRIGATMATLLPPGCTIATYSRSETVLSVLKEAIKLSKSPRVMCSEGRPSMEGHDFAREMVSLGLRVELYTDVGLISRLQAANFLLVGADALSADGLLAKVGTTALLRAADHGGILRYAVLGTEKVLPQSLREELRLRASGTTEVWTDPPSGVTVRNPIYEWVPLSLVSGLVTENGAVAPQELLGRVSAVRRAESFPGIHKRG